MFVSRYQKRRSRRQFSKGFTITEIIAAIIILAILASLSVNVMRNYKIRQNVEAARQQFVNALTAAMTASSKYNTTYQVIWDGTNNTIKTCVYRRSQGATNYCNGNETEFKFSLIPFSKSFPFWGGQQASNSGKANRFFLSVTPFGKVETAGATANNNSRVYFSDGEKSILTDQKLCIGAEIGTNGSVELIETTTSDSTCPQ